MGLRDKDWLPRYDSKINNIATEFFSPVLSESTVYRRIAGLFSSTSFALCARGLQEFIANGGKMQLLINPILTKEDIDAIKESLSEEKIIERALMYQLDNISSEFEKDHINALKFLLKEGFLEIRVEVPRDHLGLPLDVDKIIESDALVEKRGIFQDGDGCVLSFRGVISESRESWEKGTFDITIDVDWIDGQREHVLDDIKTFEAKWNSLETICLPKGIKDKLIGTAPHTSKQIQLEKFDFPLWSMLPGGRRLWPNQIRAVNAWIANSHAGILSMATASGKTLTALVASNLASIDMITIIIAYGKSLVRQWKKEVETFDSKADIILCDSDTNWKVILPGKLAPYITDTPQLKQMKRLYVITTPQTASLDLFQSNFSYVDSNYLQLIADEVHHLGAHKFSRALNIAASRRMGLSATFRRDWDETGTQNLIDYFGRSLEEAKYGIREGIRDGRLCRYEYFPFFAYMSADEFDEYVELSLRISREFARLKKKEDSTNLPTVSPRLEKMLNDRAEIIKKCRDKVRVYTEILAVRPKTPYVVFADDYEQVSQIVVAHKEKIRELNQISMEMQTDEIIIFSGTSDEWQRQKIFSQVTQRKTPLLAMYCLDEGVDLPQLEAALIISSSTSRRQYIQRRGRILRLGKKGKMAQLYDIIVLAFPDTDPVRNDIALEVMKKEKARLEELCEDAENKFEALLKLQREIKRIGFR